MPSRFHTPLTERLGLSTPVIQAPMAGVTTPALAAAAANAGALGFLGVGAMTPQAASKAIADTRALTQRPFGVNVFCHVPAVANAQAEAAWLSYLAPVFREFGAEPPASLGEIYKSFVQDDAMLDVFVTQRPAVVSFHFGLPDASRIRALRDAGIYLMASATSLEEALRIQDAGIDAVVAQGYEAGGHRGVFDSQARDERLGTLALTRLLARHLRIPVVAAGGIMDGAGIAAVLALGAQAAQLGTAFVACPESSADAAFRVALTDPGAVTAMTAAISGRRARGLYNRLMRLGEAPDSPPVPDYPIAYDAGKALNAAAKARGNSDFAAQWAGQAVRLSRALPAGELVAVLTDELEQSLAGLRALAG
ncbi:NAD(P)H-dependent flavin oxidoreductase [Bordetella bronchialis]|uniref:Propionate 3-nitronate monooxygenase n=1 Tax=Bordetella bronchialis TaxID=463025 RepID=A0ABN4R231_9BORD|nr:nitronate monooxygenase [Bordetella bronchialis]ANN67319.1 2-nitropropane dioxygenase [Bordetella bronchialis]